LFSVETTTSVDNFGQLAATSRFSYYSLTTIILQRSTLAP